MIRSLELTLGLDPAVVDTFDAFRKKRNTADYERAGVISDTEAAEIAAFALKLREDVEAWIAGSYPHLKP